jgi:photosystem II stability/assembly factor-like uncharacterized protein
MRLTLIISILFLACQSNQKPGPISFSIKPQSSPSTASIRGISVVDSNVIWLSGAAGTILQTTDGGKQWNIIPAPDQDSLDYRDVHAFSAQEAIVVSAGFPARVYRTLDRGENWQLVYENQDSAAFMNSIHFKSRSQGIIVGDQLNGCHLVLKTENIGGSWKRIDCINLPKPLKTENGFAASGSCITISPKGNYLIGLGGEKSRVFKSPKGNVWQATETTLGGGKPSRGIYSIAASPNKVIAVGGDYTQTDSSHAVSISVDNGNSWQSGGKVHGYRSVIAYCKPYESWFCAGITGIELSLDGGKSWEVIGKQNINTLQFDRQSGKGWAAGPKGEIYLINKD